MRLFFHPYKKMKHLKSEFEYSVKYSNFKNRVVWVKYSVFRIRILFGWKHWSNPATKTDRPRGLSGPSQQEVKNGPAIPPPRPLPATPKTTTHSVPLRRRPTEAPLRLGLEERNLPAMQLLKVLFPHLETDRSHSEFFGKRLEEMVSWTGFCQRKACCCRCFSPTRVWSSKRTFEK